MSRTLVTGCAGFIGSHLTDSLLERGHQVMGVDSFEDYYDRSLKEANIAAALENGAFSLWEANLLNLVEPAEGLPSLRELVAEADVVYHLAAQPGVRASWGATFETYTKNNVLATQVLLEACKEQDIQGFVYASSSSVYGDTNVFPMREDAVCVPYSPYGVTKLAGEHLARLYWRNFGLPTVSLRFFTVYGPRQRPDMAFRRFIQAALEGQPIHVFGDGTQTRDFTYVSDIIDGILAAPSAPGGTVANLAGGSRVSLMEAIDALRSVVGGDIEIVREPAQAGDVRDTWASIEVARALLGYNPQVQLEQGLRSAVDWLSSVR